MDTPVLELNYAERLTACLLDSIARPAFLLTHDCRLIHMNARGKRAVAYKRGLTTCAGRLVLERRAETVKLHEIVAAMALDGLVHSDFLIFSVPGELSPNSLLMHSMAMADPSPPQECPAAARQVLVTVHYRQDSPGFTQERIKAAFGFTRAESQVVLGLAAGRKLADIAAATNRSIHTVRLHLKRALSKADCHSQSELMNVLIRTIDEPI